MFLCGAFDLRCSVDGSPSKFCFVWRISPEVFCRWSLFKVMFLCGALCSTQKHIFEEGPSTEHPWANAPHKNITLKEDHLQNTSGLMLHTKT
jgi:hypothetical protein